MSAGAVTSTDLPIYPGHMWLDAVGSSWRDMAMRGYSLAPLNVAARAPRHVLVLYKSGTTTMQRQIQGTLTTDRVVPGDISVKSFNTLGSWSWDAALDVIHIYLHPELLTRTAMEIYGHAVADVTLRDCVKTRDEELSALIGALERETLRQAPGTELMVQLLQKQLAITLLRNHGNVTRPPRQKAVLDSNQQRLVVDYIASNLHQNLTVARLANQVGLSEDHFSRLFRATFDSAPHRHVMRVRCAAARERLRDPSRSLADIACEMGFADQSHLTRCIRREFGEAPSALRRLT